MTKIGVISDTHLPNCDERLDMIFQQYFKDADLILHAGDLVDIRVLDAFNGKRVVAVCGNMDPLAIRDILPDKLILDLGGFRIGLIHGWGAPYNLEDKLLKELGKVDCLVYGHTHRPANVEKDGVLFFNPGTATDSRFGGANTIGIIEIDGKITGRIVELNSIS
jgi:uncharacterized protein